jgi:hypothetical protein
MEVLMAKQIRRDSQSHPQSLLFYLKYSRK